MIGRFESFSSVFWFWVVFVLSEEVELFVISLGRICEFVTIFGHLLLSLPVRM